MKRFTLAIAVMLLWIVGKAQVPGYCDQRLTVFYYNHLGPSAKGPNASGNMGIFAPNYRQSFAIDYVTGRHVSFMLSADIYTTGVKYSQAIQVPQTIYSPGWGFITQYYPSSKVQVAKGIDIAIDYKAYFKSALAPVGTYFKMGLRSINGKVNYSRDEFSYRDETGQVLYAPNLGNGKYSTFTLDFGWGKQRIYFNKLVVDAGIDMCFSGSMFSAAMGEYQTDLQEDYIANEAINRALRMHLLNMHLGIGYLTF